MCLGWFWGSNIGLGRDIYPMNRTFNNAYDYTGWNYTSESVFSGAWVRVDAMRNYSILQNATATNPDPNGLVPTGNRWKGTTYTCLVGQMPTIDYAGAILIHGGSTPNGAYSHAIFATEGTNASNIKACANSADYCERNFSAFGWSANTYVHIIVPTQYIFTTTYDSVNFRSNYVYGTTSTNLLHSGAEITGKTLYSIRVTSIKDDDVSAFDETFNNTSYYSIRHAYTVPGMYTITVTVKETASSAAKQYLTYAKIV